MKRLKSLWFLSPPDDAGTGTVENKEVHVGDKAKEFGKRFRPPPEMAAKHNLPSNEDSDVIKSDEELKAVVEEKKVVTQPDDEVKAKPGSFVHKQIERARLAEKERDELRGKVEKYEKEEKVQLQTQIGELQKKIDSGNFTSQQEEKFQQQIESLRTEKEKTETELKQQLGLVNERLAVYNLAESPDFQREYIKPLADTQSEMLSILGDNKPAQQQLANALMLNKNAMESKTPEERAALEKRRDEIMDSIIDGMGTTTQNRFTSVFQDFLKNHRRQFEALSKPRDTDTRLREEANERAKQASQKILNKWNSAYESLADEDEFKEGLTDDEITKAKELGIELQDPKELDKQSRDVLSPSPDVKKSMQVLHRGRIAPILAAKVKIQAAIIKEQAETIEKLKGAGTGGSSHTSDNGAGPRIKDGKDEKGNAVNPDGKTREQWQKERFKLPTR